LKVSLATSRRPLFLTEKILKLRRRIMSQSATKSPSRNAPCFCGSGRKFKHCCGAYATVSESVNRPSAPKAKRDLWLIVFGMLSLIAVSIFALVSVNRRAQTTSRAVSPLNQGPMPKPFEYDAANNRHWDPAHAHWHDGPPPAASARN
jgi:hypothetical protein